VIKPTEDDEYDQMLSLWSDLESGLGIILGSPASIKEFLQRVRQYDRWMQALLQQDTDIGLYLLFQLASNSFVGYSASHALVSAVLCHLIAVDLNLPVAERDSLVHAALTMNIAMTHLQDHLAGQIEKPSAAQQIAISSHAVKGALMLSNMGILDGIWLDTISLHHDKITDTVELHDLPTARRLARILNTVDRYGAMISPRKSRMGRSATESAKALVGKHEAANRDEVGQALLRAVGMFPPGTYVQLDNDEIAVVRRRSHRLDLPDVAIVVSKTGQPVTPPRPHRTSAGKPLIRTGLTAASVEVNVDHNLILRLGTETA
jgi:HD-GYP domain-containing protein (c-di-GMP phosphodiesterase class II)